MKRLTSAILAVATFVALAARAAVPGVTGTEILIGQDVDMSGPISVRMKQR